mmetsp:Transcript_8207/g.13832  ORF Transcript_8207/g.13832 Transcript_8207/m.13832 type:complete len:282 (+) Transcript_8207:865-1710(+)
MTYRAQNKIRTVLHVLKIIFLVSLFSLHHIFPRHLHRFALLDVARGGRGLGAADFSGEGAGGLHGARHCRLVHLAGGDGGRAGDIHLRHHHGGLGVGHLLRQHVCGAGHAGARFFRCLAQRLVAGAVGADVLRAHVGRGLSASLQAGEVLFRFSLRTQLGRLALRLAGRLGTLVRLNIGGRRSAGINLQALSTQARGLYGLLDAAVLLHHRGLGCHEGFALLEHGMHQAVFLAGAALQSLSLCLGLVQRKLGHRCATGRVYATGAVGRDRGHVGIRGSHHR